MVTLRYLSVLSTLRAIPIIPVYFTAPISMKPPVDCLLFQDWIIIYFEANDIFYRTHEVNPFVSHYPIKEV